MTDKTGGPAFPFWSDTQHLAGYEGMSLRDYFAAKAIAQVDWNTIGIAAGAETCFELADAMIKAREQ